MAQPTTQTEGASPRTILQFPGSELLYRDEIHTVPGVVPVVRTWCEITKRPDGQYVMDAPCFYDDIEQMPVRRVGESFEKLRHEWECMAQGAALSAQMTNRPMLRNGEPLRYSGQAKA